MVAHPAVGKGHTLKKQSIDNDVCESPRWLFVPPSRAQLYLKESLEMFRKQSLLPPGEYFCQDGVSHVVADHMGLVHAQLLPQEESVVRGIGHRVNVDILE